MAENMNSIYLNPFSLDCALLAAGGVLQTVDKVMESGAAGIAVVRPPGHHAEPHTPHGFCLFNNVSIAAQYAVTQLGVEKVLILDWDVHHGNGIQHMFYNNPNVLYISLHRYDYGAFFPQSSDADYDMVGEGAGKGFNVNIPWNGRKFGDSEYLLGFNNVVLPIAYEFQPQLVLVSAGFDAAEGDPLGGYKVSPAMYGYMTHQLSALAEGRVVVALEGGYNLATISDCATQCAKALLGDPLPLIKVGEAKESALQTVRDVIKEQSEFWSCMAVHNKLLPLEVGNNGTKGGAEETGLESQLEQLNVGTSRSVVRSVLVKNREIVQIADMSDTESTVPENLLMETKEFTEIKINETKCSTTEGISLTTGPIQSCTTILPPCPNKSAQP